MDTKPNILIVDDNAVFCLSMQDVLKQGGYAVRYAINGKDGIALSQKNGYDVVLVDINLPDISGVEVVNEITEISPSTEFIYITGHAEFDSAVEAVKQKHVVSYVTKPLDSEHFLLFIEQIFKRREAEKTQKEFENKYRDLIETANDAIVCDINGTITEWNKSAENIFGYSKSEIIGKQVSNLIPEKYNKEYRKGLEGLLKTGESKIIGKIVEVSGITKEGTEIPIEMSLTAQKIGKERYSFTAIIRDLTERKWVEVMMDAKNSFLRILQVAAVAANEAVEIEDAFLPILSEVCRYTGWPIGHAYMVSEDNPNLLEPTTIWCPDKMDRFTVFQNITANTKFEKGEGLLGRVLDREKPYWIEDIINDPNFVRAKSAEEAGLKSGFAFPVMAGAKVVSVLEFFGTEKTVPDYDLLEIMADVGAQLGRVIERKQAEESLKKSEKRYRTLVEIIPYGIQESNVNGIITFSNQAYHRMHGYNDGELVGKAIWELSESDKERDKIREYLEKLIEKKTEPRPYITKDRTKDGRVIDIQMDCAYNRDEQGSTIGFVFVVTDITERRKHEEQIRKLSHATEQSPCSVVITDVNGNIEYVNSKFTKVSGYNSKEVIGKTLRILKSGKTPPEIYKQLWETITLGGEWKGEFQNKKKSGEIYWEYVTISPIKNVENKITHFIAIKEDITEQKQKDKLFLMQVRQAQMGEMLSMIAHQWRQPLTTISSIASNITNRLVLNKIDKEDLINHMLKIQDSCKYLSQTINDFRNFFKPNKAKEQVKIENVIRKCLDIVSKPMEMNSIKIDVSCGSGKEIEIYSNELIHVLVNIMKNAEDIIKDRKIENAIVAIREYEEDGFIVIDITDNAGGISEDIIDDIFLPYFSTRDEKQGTGLGLYMSKTIIEEHCKGEIKILNVDGGAKFTIRLPINN